MALDAIGITVEEIARARAFYSRLGLEISEDAEGHGHAEAELPGGLRLMLDTVESIRSFDPAWEPPSGSPRAALAFGFATPAEVDAKFHELVGAGAGTDKAPWDAIWGQRYARLRDPDGNGVDLFAALGAAST